MTPSEAVKILTATVDEAKSNAAFIEASASYVVSSSPIVYAGHPGEELKSLLSDLHQLRKLSPVAAYRGLIVQIVAAFEIFMANLCTAYFEDLEAGINSGGAALDEAIRSRYLAKAGVALSKLPTGTVDGAKFDFSYLEQSLPSILRREPELHFQAAVLFVRMGSCNSDKVEKIFEWFSRPTPFNKHLGAHKATQAWRRGSMSPTAAAAIIKEELDELVKLRNDLAHGELNTVTIDTVCNAGALVVALSNALADAV